MGRLGQHRDPSRGRLGHRLDQIGSLFPEIKNDKKSLVFIIIKKELTSKSLPGIRQFYIFCLEAYDLTWQEYELDFQRRWSHLP